MSRKTRKDSVLGTLPEERQAEIADYCRQHSLQETVGWLRQDGVHTSRTALGEWLSSWRLQQQMGRNAATVETLLDRLQSNGSGWSPEQLGAAGQAFFDQLAIEQQDPKIWVATQQLKLDRESAQTKAGFERQKIELRKQAEARSQEKLRFEREKWVQESCRKILAAATDARAKEIAEMDLSNAEKIALLRKTYFADVDELEKSGEVQIPK